MSDTGETGENTFVKRFPTILAVMVVVFVVVTVIFTVKQPGEEFEKSTFYRLFLIVAAFGTVFIALNLYYDALKTRETRAAEQELSTTAVIDRLWLRQNEYMQANFDSAPTLVMQMYPEIDFKQVERPCDDKCKVTETVIAIRAFQAWEDYRTLAALDQTGAYVWMVNDLRWGQSARLYDLWTRLQANFALSTIRFGNAIFQNSWELNKLQREQGGVLYPIDYYRQAAKLVPQLRELWNRDTIPDLDKISEHPEQWSEVARYTAGPKSRAHANELLASSAATISTPRKSKT